MHIASRFQSTPLIRGETRAEPKNRVLTLISIHSPHTRGDAPSARPAPPRRHFNPLPSHEGRRFSIDQVSTTAGISIHSPHTRGDRNQMQQGFCAIQFQSTPLTRGETTPCSRFSASQQFQSTPLIRGETCRGWCEAAECINFNPLPSCEGRRSTKQLACWPTLFQSTPLMRGETEKNI